MKWIKTLALIAAMLLAFVFAALSVNQQEIALTFAIWETPFLLSMFWWLLMAFAAGLLFGLVNGAWLNVKHRLRNRRLQQELVNSTAELERLRSLTVQSTQPQSQ
jgi:uncharacterized membrane protein YciS (DUF1049 family)